MTKNSFDIVEINNTDQTYVLRRYFWNESEQHPDLEKAERSQDQKTLRYCKSSALLECPKVNEGPSSPKRRRLTIRH